MTTTTPPVTAQEPVAAGRRRKPPLSEGARAERRLGWLLCAPAVIVMVAVTAYPIGYAIYLSFQRYILSAPQLNKFVGFSNYAAVLSSPFWWHALIVTIVITVVSVAVELVLGMLLALLMYRTIFGRGTVRTTMLIPYGIVTIVAAFGWQYAWTPSTGYLSALFHNSAPLTNTNEAIAIIISAEIWKTTPFMALLLMAGLSLVPEDLLKAAKVDGATAWQRFCADHGAADEAGDPGRAAVPDAGRVPDIRQHLHPHQRREQHRRRCRCSTTTTCSPASTSGSGRPCRS